MRMGMTRDTWLYAPLGLVLFACHPASPAEGGTAAGACAADWFDPPAVAPSIAVPSGNGRMVLRAAATGSQNYACTLVAGDGGTSYAWSLVGPEATLSDCHSAPIGRHFASDAGAAAPEWQMTDGAYVIGKKMAAAPADGASVPWLLLSVEAHGGTAPFTEAHYVQRTRTSGGVAPSAGCDSGHVGEVRKVPYTADYLFYAP
jgi:hypothetical protein